MSNEHGDKKADRHEPTAYRHARAAVRNLDQAAEALGYEDVHALANAARDGEFDDIDLAVRSITNAHSYLNNGGLETLER